MSQVPPFRLPASPCALSDCCDYCQRKRHLYGDTCAGCGAPLPARAHALDGEIEITVLEDLTPRFIASGFLSVNEARQMNPFAQPEPNAR